MRAFFRSVMIFSVMMALPAFATHDVNPTSIDYFQAVARIRNLNVPATAASAATAWHIGNGIVVTAGHVVSPRGPGKSGQITSPNQVNADQISIHFNLNNPSMRYYDFDPRYLPDEKSVALQANQQIEQVIAAAYADGPPRDYAVLQLKPPFPTATLEMGIGTLVTVGDEVIVPAFSLGQSPRVLHGKIVDTSGGFYGYDVESMDGVSGAPVIHSKTGKVIAIHHGKVSVPNPNYDAIHGRGYQFLSVAIGQKLDKIPELAEIISRATAFKSEMKPNFCTTTLRPFIPR